MRTSFLVAAAVTVCASAVEAQGDAASLPAPLVTALLSGARYLPPPSTGPVQYFVQQLPPQWPAALVPSNASVVGGQTAGKQTIAVFSDTSRRFLANFLQQAERAGWTQPEMPGAPGFGSGGGVYGFHCKDSTQLSARAVPGASVGALIHVQLVKTQFPRCVAAYPERLGMTQDTRTRLHLPTLTPPPDASSHRGGSSSNGEDVSANARLRLEVPVPVAVLRHYVAQLNTAGWTAEPPLSTERLAAVILSAKDSSGRAWSGSLVVTAVGKQATVDLTMRPVTTP